MSKSPIPAMARKLLLISVLLLLPGRSAAAKGPTPRITIEGAEFMTAIEVESAEDRETFYADLFHLSSGAQVAAPGPVGPLYLITGWYRADDGEWHAYDRVVYAPGEEGAVGYVYRLGMVNGSAWEDGRWFHAGGAGAAAFRRILNDHHVNLTQAVRTSWSPTESHSAPTGAANVPGLLAPRWAVAAVSLLTLMLAVWAVGRGRLRK